jgi:hypothetical protein
MNAPEIVILEEDKGKISSSKVKFGVNTFYNNNMSAPLSACGFLPLSQPS